MTQLPRAFTQYDKWLRRARGVQRLNRHIAGVTVFSAITACVVCALDVVIMAEWWKWIAIVCCVAVLMNILLGGLARGWALKAQMWESRVSSE